DFEYELDDWQVDPHVYQELVDAVGAWKRSHHSADRPFLYYSKAMDFITVYDGRNSHAPARHRFDWPEAGIIEACNETAKSEEQIRVILSGHKTDVVSAGELASALATLTARRILYEERGKYFTLAVPENPYL
ncbi:MAG TPA: RiPP maturation radical SAM protein 1, partial [Nitrospiraceae bacterium]